MTLRILRHFFWGFCTCVLVFSFSEPAQAREGEKTYSISLIKTAEIEEDIYEIDDKKVLAQEYAVQKGDYIWKILRKKGLLQRRNLSELFSMLKKLNKSLRNLDLIYPGEKIIIPLKIIPLARRQVKVGPSLERVIPVTELKDVNFDNYTVKPGDSLIKIVKGRYNMPPKHLYDEYLDLAKKLNPSVKDLDTIYPGQVIKLPIYSPEIVRRPIVPPTAPKAAISSKPKKKSEDKKVAQKVTPLARDLARLFLEMGEEWVRTGEHFIPLKSGGQINLKAESFPIIDLRNGQRVIVDLKNKLPNQMVKLIASSWGNYRVVHVLEKDDLRSALGKILKVCNYPKVLKRGEPIGLQGDVAFRITGDWIVMLPESRADNRPGVIVINLIHNRTSNTPRMIKDYLRSLDVSIIDYPSANDDASEEMDQVEILEAGKDSSSLVRTILNHTVRSFRSHVQIPVYQSERAEFRFTINADFFLKIKERDAIIDLTGLSPEIISFLKEHQFSVLSLGAEKEPVAVVEKTLEFLDVQFARGPHSFMATSRDDSRNIRFSLPGIVFSGLQGKAILATPLNLPDEIAAFLSKRGYKILPCRFSESL